MDGYIYAVPGQGAISSTQEREILWGGTDNQIRVLRTMSTYSSTLVDAGNTPTTLIRAGNLVGPIGSDPTTSEMAIWDPLAVDGTQFYAGVVPINIKMTEDGTAADKVYHRIVSAPLRASRLLIKGAAFVGHAYEYLARQQMNLAGCILDDDPCGFLSGNVARTFYDTTTALTPTAAQNGGTFFLSNAAAVAVTLPTIKAGLRYTFVRTADEEMTVTGTGALLVGNSATAGTITFTTAGQQIGAAVQVEAKYIASAGTLKWVTTMPWAFFGTGTASMAYAIT